MLNKKLKLSLITIATLVATNTNAQTFYQCLPCPAGTYASGGKCTPCPAGTYSQVSGGTSSAVCTACPDYQWSNAGATKCNDIKVTLFKADWSGSTLTHRVDTTFTLRELNSGVKCHCSNFALGCENGNRNGDCGVNSLHLWYNGDTIKIQCRTLPCYIGPIHGGRYFAIGTDGRICENIGGTCSPNGVKRVSW